MADTIRVRGEGGWEFDMDVPDDPTKRELFDDAVANGRLTILSAPEVDEPSDPAPSDVPDGSIDKVTEWVRGGPEDQEPTEGWEQRAADALAAELAKGDDARSSLVKLLSPLVEPPAED